MTLDTQTDQPVRHAIDVRAELPVCELTVSCNDGWLVRELPSGAVEIVGDIHASPLGLDAAPRRRALTVRRWPVACSCTCSVGLG